MADRVILADCCEDWILEWGPYYDPGAPFACPECDTEWRADGGGRYTRAGDRHTFRRRERPAGEGRFAFLSAEDGRQPIVERCCAKILLQHGRHLSSGVFRCPVCRTEWTVGSTRSHGLVLPAFTKAGLEESLTVQPGRTRPFLVTLSRYSAPRE